MAASSISMLALLLLMSAVTPGLSTEGEGSQDHTSAVLINAMREVSRALECFGDAVQEGLRQQRQSRDALTDLHTLTATVLRVEERINQQGGMIESLKEKNEDITKLNDLQVKFEAKSRESEQNLEKVEALTQEIEDLKNQLHNKNHTLDDLQLKFEAKSRESEQNLEKVQDLGRNLDESRRYAEKLELLVQQLNNTQESQKKDVPGCAEQPPQKIKNLVLQYSGSRDWQTLERGLDAEMDHSSKTYGELKNISQWSMNPLYHIGYYGYTQLATLLLSAGMPVDLTVYNNYTMLLGAAFGGHYQLAKMLLSRGANVNAKNNNGHTPLFGAAHNGNLETVKLLVQAGADTTATDQYGRNALYYPKYLGHTAVQQYLEQFPA